MKKIFTLLSLCFVALSTFAQDWVATPESGQQYYIAVGNNKVGYITANEDGGKLTAKAATEGDKEKQTWTCTKGENDVWKFTVTVDGQEWTMYTNEGERLAAGTDPGSNFKDFTITAHDDDPSNAYSSIKMKAGESGNLYANIFGGQSLGNEFGPWAYDDNGSKVYFVKASEVEIPTWNFNLIFSSRVTTVLVTSFSSTELQQTSLRMAQQTWRASQVIS